MNKTLAAIVLPQIDELIVKYEEIKKRSKYEDCSDISRDEASEFLTASMTAIHRAAGKDSQFATQADYAIEKNSPHYISIAIPTVGGALKALRHAIDAGYLISVQELIHANLFADFLEMAEHLLTEGYKDPAAVLIGGILEEHLRKLCDKNNISIEVTDSKGVSRPKKAEVMNIELAGKGVYSKLDQKNVTAWLDLRNKAAHGHYNEYTSPQVELLLQSVRDFLTRHSA